MLKNVYVKAITKLASKGIWTYFKYQCIDYILLLNNSLFLINLSILSLEIRYM